MSEHLKGATFLVAAAICWSFAGLWIKLVNLSPMAVAGARSAIAAIAIAALMGRSSVQLLRWLTPRHLFGAVAYAATVICFVVATKHTTAANAILLQYTAPVWVALLSTRMLGERTTWHDWVAIAAVLAGMTYMMSGELQGGGFFGDLLAVASGVFFALNVIVLRKERNADAIGMVLLGNVAAAIIGLPFLLVGPMPGTSDILYLLLLGTLQLAAGYALFVRGIRHVPAVEAALIPVMEPILNPIWVAIFYGEHPQPATLIGGAIVVGTVTLRGVLRAAGTRAAGKNAAEEPQVAELPPPT